ncbi:MAG: fumarylacetoacetate hydrolase family protein [Prevotellaceae bacterium]|jgi:2-keto-4-pentenoate hydratase/2-oxohepta-3-ene-1,7-dioic acid hydratase in catechol pathway|nr:fumarylacetoacetate hydrolase family protein [Prevotellaceae bacterium]
MKIIVFENIFAENTLNTDRIAVSFRVDSTIIKGNKPFYMPEFSGDFAAQLFAAAKVCKLGKNIATRFAHRYYDTFALSICLKANDLLQRKETQNLAVSFDGATSLSNFFPVEKMDFKQANIDFHFNNNIYTVNNFEHFISITNEMIAYASKFCILKTGDLLLSELNFEVKNIKIGDKMSVFFNKNKILEQKIK